MSTAGRRSDPSRVRARNKTRNKGIYIGKKEGIKEERRKIVFDLIAACEREEIGPRYIYRNARI